MGTPEELKTVLGHIEAGRLRPVIDSVFPLEKIAEAHRRVAERAVFGKVVVTL
jgi:NADPH:quinone reductase-like Zn-dependent oxidoreductase